MAYLLDTSILSRLANTADAHYPQAAQAVMELHAQGERLHITPQVLIEFRGMATRPIAQNGLGLPLDEVESLAAEFEAVFSLLEETPDIYPIWKSIVGSLGVIGKQVHDARLAAVCHVNSISHVLTFNIAHFARLATAPPGFTVVDPRSF